MEHHILDLKAAPVIIFTQESLGLNAGVHPSGHQHHLGLYVRLHLGYIHLKTIILVLIWILYRSKTPDQLGFTPIFCSAPSALIDCWRIKRVDVIFDLGSIEDEDDVAPLLLQFGGS